MIITAFRIPDSAPRAKDDHMPGTTFKLAEGNGIRADAKAKCEEWGGNLASLDTPAVLEFAKQLVNTLPVDTEVIVGAECVGCAQSEDDKWMWQNGNPLPVGYPGWGMDIDQQCAWDYT